MTAGENWAVGGSFRQVKPNNKKGGGRGKKEGGGVGQAARKGTQKKASKKNQQSSETRNVKKTKPALDPREET